MSKPTFIRALGLTDATLLVVGCIVGVGIFRTASAIAGHLPSAPLILLLWVLGGVVSLCGALCYAELAAMFPSTGGDYIYINRIYGRFWGFLFGWTKLFIERTGTIAILGFVFAEYVSRVIPYGEAGLRGVATGAIVLLTGVNVIGIRWGKYLQNTLTAVKIATLGSLIAVGLQAHAARATVPVSWTIPPVDLGVLQSMGVAFVFVLWTYGGWTEAAYVAEEIRRPTRNVPRAIIGGIALTAALYALVNWTYLILVPLDALPKTPLVASRVMEGRLEPTGAVLIAWLVACSAFGALNGYILTGSRILYAIGKDHALFAQLGTIHPTFRTPALASWMNALIAVGLVWTKTFDQIMTYSTVVISVFFTMAVFGVIVLRRAMPGHPRPYRAWGYPLTPILFCLTMTAFILDVAVKQPAEAAFGFGLMALGLPLYRLSQRLLFMLSH